jgi:hypothetical protein
MKKIIEYAGGLIEGRLIETADGRRTVKDATEIGCPVELRDRIAAKNSELQRKRKPSAKRQCRMPDCSNERSGDGWVCKAHERFAYLFDSNGNVRDDAEVPGVDDWSGYAVT